MWSSENFVVNNGQGYDWDRYMEDRSRFCQAHAETTQESADVYEIGDTGFQLPSAADAKVYDDRQETPTKKTHLLRRMFGRMVRIFHM